MVARSTWGSRPDSRVAALKTKRRNHIIDAHRCLCTARRLLRSYWARNFDGGGVRERDSKGLLDPQPDDRVLILFSGEELLSQQLHRPFQHGLQRLEL
jgi:hypothetical protein